jgi:hypothetical protein
VRLAVVFGLLAGCAFDPSGLALTDGDDVVADATVAFDAEIPVTDGEVPPDAFLVSDGLPADAAVFPDASVPCDPLTGGGCATGSCRLDEAGDVGCFAGVGSGQQFAPCTTFAQCAVGYRCHHDNPMDQPGDCLRVCDVDDPLETCSCFATAPPTVVNDTEYGSCFF